MLEQGQSVRSPPREGEGAAETVCALTRTPIPHPPALLGREEVEKTGSDAEPRNKGGVGGSVFRIWFYFSLFYSDLIGKKLN